MKKDRDIQARDIVNLATFENLNTKMWKHQNYKEFMKMVKLQEQIIAKANWVLDNC